MPNEARWYNPAVPPIPGIYIHIPFCERKCAYCAFNTTDFFEDLAGRYVEAVKREIESRGASLRNEAGRLAVDSIYLGGGTPSIVEAEQIAALLEACRAAFDVAPQAEVTIEINPGSFSSGRVGGWLAAGVNRASVGAQSFRDHELKAMGRNHSPGDTRRTVELLRASGFENISLDLIAGWPGQTIGDWEHNLNETIELRPEHLSLYLLEVKPGTQLSASIQRGRVNPPDDDLAAQMYEILCETTRAAGYYQYEISNFALTGEAAERERIDLRSQHNLKYWTGATFYGMGSGAHSYDGRARWHNLLNTEAYITAVSESGTAVAERLEPGAGELAAEALFMGLRLTEGVELTQFRDQYGLDPIERFGDDYVRLRDAGLISVSGGRLALTERGRLLSNEVFVAII
jgi:oxygen-independent coproporphyrinogen-3 oxidase